MAGTYQVTITDANGCTHIGVAVITEPSEMLVSGTVTNVSCPGASNGTIVATVSNGTAPYSYSWNTYHLSGL